MRLLQTTSRNTYHKIDQLRRQIDYAGILLVVLVVALLAGTVVRIWMGWSGDVDGALLLGTLMGLTGGVLSLAFSVTRSDVSAKIPAMRSCLRSRPHPPVHRSCDRVAGHPDLRVRRDQHSRGAKVSLDRCFGLFPFRLLRAVVPRRSWRRQRRRLAMADRNDGYFRASAGAIVIDSQKRVLALRRKGTAEEAWQMPQGGIGKDEAPEHAAWRELQEETGLTWAELSELLGASREWLVVQELPEAFGSPKVGWGQAQRWFLFRARPGAKVRPDSKEFDAFEWVTHAGLLSRVVERRPVYVRVFSEFANWLEP